jgi:hypothetical protein
MENNENDRLVKVILNVSDDTFGVSGERVWAKPVGTDLYEIRNTPWHTCDVNWGDIVHAVPANEKEWPKFIEIVERSGHRTLHLFFYKETDDKYRSKVLDRLKEWKANYENANGNLYAFDVQPDGDMDGLCAFLDELGNTKVDYRTVVSPISE